jgi:hypothetical protein
LIGFIDPYYQGMDGIFSHSFLSLFEKTVFRFQ